MIFLPMEKSIILDLVENIKNIKGQLKSIERYIREVASLNPAYKLLLTITGCGPITAATVIAETGNIRRFKTQTVLFLIQEQALETNALGPL